MHFLKIPVLVNIEEIDILYFFSILTKTGIFKKCIKFQCSETLKNVPMPFLAFWFKKCEFYSTESEPKMALGFAYSVQNLNFQKMLQIPMFSRPVLLINRTFLLKSSPPRRMVHLRTTALFGMLNFDVGQEVHF